jgi:hypothetical protein
MIAVPARHRALLIAAGASGRITALVSTRIGGMAFAAGLVLPFRNPQASPFALSCFIAT